ncbi:MAG: AzlC family ABC transporter permease [Chloroflexota bacterium]|nr:AzlC family ABC transporter permease [Chloroflexota bacterium]
MAHTIVDEETTNRDEHITFTFAGAFAGMRRSLPLVISDFAVGIVFGVLARRAGLSLVQVLLMSGLVFGGSAQFAALSLWVTPLPVIALLLTTLVVNSRHLLMGAALRPWFVRLPRARAYASLFFLTDESWALAISDFARGGRDAAFLVGSGLALLLAWVSATGIGYVAGALIQSPEQWGLDFAFTAVFVALLVGMWKGKSHLLPWAVAAMVAVAAAHWLPGKWYILAGGLAGSIVGALTNAK